jgi:hypothetical protein
MEILIKTVSKEEVSMISLSRPGFFRAVADSQSYLNILYLLLALPLGILYFAFLVSGFSLGAGLLVTLAGIPVLLFVLAGSSVLSRLERMLAVKLLKVDVPNPPKFVGPKGLWQRVKARFSDRLIWRETLYLLFKFPVGVFAFTVAVTLLAVSIGFTFAPVYMWASDPLTWGGMVLSPYPWAWILMVIGIPMFFISVNLLNAVAAGLGNMAKAMLAR